MCHRDDRQHAAKNSISHRRQNGLKQDAVLSWKQAPTRTTRDGFASDKRCGCHACMQCCVVRSFPGLWTGKKKLLGLEDGRSGTDESAWFLPEPFFLYPIDPSATSLTGRDQRHWELPTVFECLFLRIGRYYGYRERRVLTRFKPGKRLGPGRAQATIDSLVGSLSPVTFIFTLSLYNCLSASCLFAGFVSGVKK